MLDLKRFLRFEISGYVAILYAVLLCAAFFNLALLKQENLLGAARLIDYSVAGFILAAPIGFIMHQIDISLFSPFREKRGIWPSRNVIAVLKQQVGEKAGEYQDEKYQAALELRLSSNGMTHLDNEISNRYSYYYARMEAGIFSPLLGLVLFFLAKMIIEEIRDGSIVRFSVISIIIPVSIVLISALILWYIPTLFRELNDLECKAVTHSHN